MTFRSTKDPNLKTAWSHSDLWAKCRRALPGVTVLFIALVIVVVRMASSQFTVSVLQFGAIADGSLRTDGAMTAGSSVLTSPTASFSAADVGKYIQVIGAGRGGTRGANGSMIAGSAVLNSASGTFAPTDVGRGIIVPGAGASAGNLVTTIAGYTSATSVTLGATATRGVSQTVFYYGAMTLEAGIRAVQSPTSVQLTVAASATVNNATYAYGTNNQAAFQTAVDSVGQAGGGRVEVPQAPACPQGAVCGYVIAAIDQMSARAPAAVKIRYSNVALAGKATDANLFCRGAWGTYSNSAKFPGQTAAIRGNCLAIGDSGGPNGAAGESVSNVSISRLHLYGMTNGNTYNTSFSPTGPPLTTTGDGWDITHKAIYLWESGTFSNILIDAVSIQDFKGENICSGGSAVTGMVIENSSMTNFNGDGISVLAADLQVRHNAISNGSNAGIENATMGAGPGALRRQTYVANHISTMPNEAIVIYGVDNTIPSGSVQISGNHFDTIAQINPGVGRTAILVIAQSGGNSGGNNVAPANISITGNECHDCRSFGVLESSGNTQVTENRFIVDHYNASNFLSFTFPMRDFFIARNTGYATAAGQSLDSVYVLNPGYLTGNFAWNNVTVQGNVWKFSGTSNYAFNPAPGPGWDLVTARNVIWQGDTCTGCTYPDGNHGLVDLSARTVIQPYGPVVHVNGNTTSVLATIDAAKEQDGSHIRIVNAGSFPVVFQSDTNLRLASPVSVPPGGSISFRYHGAIHRFIAE